MSVGDDGEQVTWFQTRSDRSRSMGKYVSTKTGAVEEAMFLMIWNLTQLPDSVSLDCRLSMLGIDVPEWWWWFSTCLDSSTGTQKVRFDKENGRCRRLLCFSWFSDLMDSLHSIVFATDRQRTIHVHETVGGCFEWRCLGCFDITRSWGKYVLTRTVLVKITTLITLTYTLTHFVRFSSFQTVLVHITNEGWWRFQ